MTPSVFLKYVAGFTEYLLQNPLWDRHVRGRPETVVPVVRWLIIVLQQTKVISAEVISGHQHNKKICEFQKSASSVHI